MTEITFAIGFCVGFTACAIFSHRLVLALQKAKEEVKEELAKIRQVIASKV